MKASKIRLYSMKKVNWILMKEVRIDLWSLPELDGYGCLVACIDYLQIGQKSI